jgi:hypothetical protein
VVQVLAPEPAVESVEPIVVTGYAASCGG